MIREIYRELLQTSDYRGRQKIEKYAIQGESLRLLKCCVSNFEKVFIELAQVIPDLNIKTDRLDTNPWLFNGELREHRQEDMITKIANIRYDKNAGCPIWKKFLMEIMNYNAKLIRFIQTAVGWAITGDTSEQSMFILYGTGANGKSAFLNTIMNLLGDYAFCHPHTGGKAGQTS
jgi:putative DNA primase/helicase